MGEAVSTSCERCTIEIAISAMQCPHCGWPGRYPNVIQASLEAEALNKRYEDALERAHSAGTGSVTQRFEKAIDGSYAVICVKVNEAHRLVFGETELKATYYATSDTRFPRAKPPAGADWDAIRELVDGALFTDPVKRHIRFAALAMTFEGLTSYGPCTLVCDTSMIEHRSSTFETNSCHFFVKRGAIPFKDASVDLPQGFRSTWPDRSKLCTAKLAAKLAPDTTEAEFAAILMERGAATADDEYVEVHICGPISLRTLKGVAIDQNAPTAVGHRGILADLRDRLRRHDLFLKENT